MRKKKHLVGGRRGDYNLASPFTRHSHPEGEGFGEGTGGGAALAFQGMGFSFFSTQGIHILSQNTPKPKQSCIYILH